MTLIAENAPTELRGTGFGIFNLVTGLALLAASTIAGVASAVLPVGGLSILRGWLTAPDRA